MPATKPDVAALVAQMPETDNEIQAKQQDSKNSPAPEPADKPKPKPSAAESKFTGPDPAAAEHIFAAILSGGTESVVELLRLVREPGDPDYQNYKAGYVVHGLVIHSGRPDQNDQRRLLAESLTAQLGSETPSKAVKKFFIRELRLIDGKESIVALGQHLIDDDLCGDAAQALLSIRDDVAPQFRSALAKSKGRNRATIIQALGTLQDAGSAAEIEKSLADDDRDVRRAAAWAVANLGQASAADGLIKAADSAEGFERTEAASVCLLLAEKLVAAGKKSEAIRIYSYLRDSRRDPADAHFRQAAESALNGIPR